MQADGGVPSTTVVVMGVSGSGKTTVAERLAERLGWEFAEGDDFHPRANVEKMAQGHSLDDDDRWPWLRTIGGWIDQREAAGRSVVVTCSALKRSYRDLLREGRPSVWFAHVTVDADVLRARLRERKGHYMPASLLDSQLATLEPLKPDEAGAEVSGAAPPDAVVNHLLTALGCDRAVQRPRPR